MYTSSWEQGGDKRQRRHTKGIDNMPQLVNVALARPEGLADQHFGKDTAHSKDVDGRAILRVAHEELGRSVPPRGDVVRVDGARAG
jgi:hypothetical protein